MFVLVRFLAKRFNDGAVVFRSVKDIEEGARSVVEVQVLVRRRPEGRPAKSVSKGSAVECCQIHSFCLVVLGISSQRKHEAFGIKTR